MDRPQKELVPLTAEQRELAGSPESIEIARAVAARWARRVPWAADECQSAAMFGLCEAAATFDPLLSAWKTWAAKIVTLRLLDRLRVERQLGMGISRDARRKGRVPVVMLGSTPLQAGSELRDMTVADLLAADDLPVGWEVESQDTVEHFSRRVPTSLGRALRAYLLQAKHDGMLKNVGDAIGVSESRVSQMMTNALAELRDREGLPKEGLHLTGRSSPNRGTSRQAKRRRELAATAN